MYYLLYRGFTWIRVYLSPSLATSTLLSVAGLLRRKLFATFSKIPLLWALHPLLGMWQLLPRSRSLFLKPAHSRLYLLPLWSLLFPPSGWDNLLVSTINRSLHLCICWKLRVRHQLSLYSWWICLSVDRFCRWLLYQLSLFWWLNLSIC